MSVGTAIFTAFFSIVYKNVCCVQLPPIEFSKLLTIERQWAKFRSTLRRLLFLNNDLLSLVKNCRLRSVSVFGCFHVSHVSFQGF